MKSRLANHIGRNGPIPFDEFMEMCLYDPDQGFFASGAVRSGEGGEFVTSPEVSPWFGRLLGRWAVGATPGEGAILVEIGAGSGSLLESLVDEVGDHFTGLFAVEVSPSAREATAGRVPSATVVSSIVELPRGRPAVVIANEVLDNMPTRLVERTADGWMETRVGESSGSLTLVSVPADPELSEWCDTRLTPAPVGRLLAAQQQFDRWMEDLAVTLGPLAICVIDYGGSTLELGQRDRGSVVRSYLSQHSGLDYLVHPGETDVTVDVNTDVLAAAAHAWGGDVTEVSQRSFLADLGVPGILADIRRRANEFASSGDVMAQLAARSEAVGIGALMDASGLGGFRVMLISRPSGSERHRW